MVALILGLAFFFFGKREGSGKSGREKKVAY